MGSLGANFVRKSLKSVKLLWVSILVMLTGLLRLKALTSTKKARAKKTKMQLRLQPSDLLKHFKVILGPYLPANSLSEEDEVKQN